MSKRGDILLTARDVRMQFTIGRDKLAVLNGVSLDVRKSETLSITGVSGCGKTTLLHILGALEHPTSGEVRIADCDVYKMSDRARSALRSLRIGYVFQAYHLLPELDVLENVILPAMSGSGWLRRAKDSRDRARSLLDRVGLADRANHRPTELSGGEQQRVALARALMNEPEILFADEPTGNLDEHTGESILEILTNLTSEFGHTLVIVTHNRQIAARCQRRLILAEGRVSCVEE